MSIQKPARGTRGTRTPPHVLAKFVGKFVTPLVIRMHRRSGDKFQGLDLLYLTTTGAHSGQPRTNPVARFDDRRGGWFVVASAGGSANHPAWYHNMVAHPDQVWIEFGGTRRHVEVEQLEGQAREEAWAQVTQRSPRFLTYLDKTDRTLPVLRLTPIP